MPWLLSRYQRFRHFMKNSFCLIKLYPIKEENNKKSKLISTQQSKSTRDQFTTASGKNYFIQARSWADDMYTQAIISRNRYKMAFFVTMGLAILLAIAINGLIPLQHLEPLLIHHYQDGQLSVAPVKQPYAPTNSSQVQSDIVRYVVNRESFDPIAYETQYTLVNLLSNTDIANEYQQEQSTANQQAPINVLGNRGFRTVHVDSIIFLDALSKKQTKPNTQKTHRNLAQVNFTTTDHFKDAATPITKAYTALVSWEYQGTASEPSERWKNWDGFTVTHYRVTQRNL